MSVFDFFCCGCSLALLPFLVGSAFLLMGISAFSGSLFFPFSGLFAVSFSSASSSSSTFAFVTALVNTHQRSRLVGFVQLGMAHRSPLPIQQCTSLKSSDDRWIPRVGKRREEKRREHTGVTMRTFDAVALLMPFVIVDRLYSRSTK